MQAVIAVAKPESAINPITELVNLLVLVSYWFQQSWTTATWVKHVAHINGGRLSVRPWQIPGAPKNWSGNSFWASYSLRALLNYWRKLLPILQRRKKKNRKSHQSISPMKNILSKELFIQRTLLIWSSRMAQELEKIDKYRGTDF